jgi:magnesium chelatase family protein
VEVGRVPLGDIAASVSPEDTGTVASRVQSARLCQAARSHRLNSRLDAADVKLACNAEPAALVLLGRAMDQLGLSARGYHRTLRVARTIADLAASDRVRVAHVAEAITLRQLDRREEHASITSAPR